MAVILSSSLSMTSTSPTANSVRPDFATSATGKTVVFASTPAVSLEPTCVSAQLSEADRSSTFMGFE